MHFAQVQSNAQTLTSSATNGSNAQDLLLDSDTSRAYNSSTYRTWLHTLFHRPTIVSAIVLALLGQFVGVVGLPVLHNTNLDSAQQTDAACGCCPADRAAKRCCCAPTPVSSCCATPVVEEEPSCCHATPKQKKAEPVQIAWIIPTLQSQCKGPLDTYSPTSVSASVPPASSVGWQFEAIDAGDVTRLVLVESTRNTLPVEPPPRTHFRVA